MRAEDGKLHSHLEWPYLSLWRVSIYPPQDLTASLLSEVCCDVGVEPALQPLDGEPLQFATANSEDGARLDVVARDFWGRNRQRAFFDVMVFNPFARSYFRSQLSRCYQLHECEKIRAYDERVRELENLLFTVGTGVCSYWWHGAHCYNSF